jgi:hypothetical protein
VAEAAGRPMLYLRSGASRKDVLIEDIRRRDAVSEGLIAVLSAVEPCRTWFVRGSRINKKLHLELGPGKCTHLYFYLIDPIFGLMHLRLQTWFPFLVQLCVNGREWLSRQLDAAALAYTREANCFTQLSDSLRVQQLLDEQLHMRCARSSKSITPCTGKSAKSSPWTTTGRSPKANTPPTSCSSGAKTSNASTRRWCITRS